MTASENVTVCDENTLIELLGIDKNLYEQVTSWSFSKIKNYNLDIPVKIVDIS